MSEAADTLAKFENRKVLGYLVVGAIFIGIGVSMMVVAVECFKPLHLQQNNLSEQLRRQLLQDRRRDTLFGAGVAVLTTGSLLFFGFGLTNLIPERQREHAARLSNKTELQLAYRG